MVSVKLYGVSSANMIHVDSYSMSHINMMIQLAMSTCTQRVATICNELGIKYEIINVDLGKGEHKTTEYLETKQPFGVIPVLVVCLSPSSLKYSLHTYLTHDQDEDGTQLFESRAICRYLTSKYGKDSGLLPDPSDIKAYGLFEQAASIEYSSFEPPASGLTKERIFAKYVTCDLMCDTC
jgi:glutathione S-transferase